MKKIYKKRSLVEVWLSRTDSLWPILTLFLITSCVAMIGFFSPELRLLSEGKSHLDPELVFLRPENRRAIGVVIFIVGVINFIHDIKYYIKNRKQKTSTPKTSEKLRKQAADAHMEKEIQERLANSTSKE